MGKDEKNGKLVCLIQEYRDKCKMDLNPSNFAVHYKGKNKTE